MIREIIKIDEEKCDGCGLCVPNCAEGALQIIDGKAKLVAEVYCDGLGACLGECPKGALSIEKREADAFDEKAVQHHIEEVSTPSPCPPGGCPGTLARTLVQNDDTQALPFGEPKQEKSLLGHWPVQLKLVPAQASFLKNANLLLCADCAPVAIPDFQKRYLEGRVVMIGCPKLDDIEYYRKKLVDILDAARPKSLTVLRMEVPCCASLAGALAQARDLVMPDQKVEIHQVGIDGSILVKRV